jgi:hypothetical protein
MPRIPFRVNEIAPNSFVVHGYIDATHAVTLVETVSHQAAPNNQTMKLTFVNASIEDGLALVIVMNMLRALTNRISGVELAGIPQTLQQHLMQQQLLAPEGPIQILDRGEAINAELESTRTNTETA